jgi:drug/metabolite transporter (DMT)-like permease
MSEPDHREGSDQPTPLEYGRPEPSKKMVVQAILGCIAAVAIIGVCGFASGFMGFAIGYGDQGHPGIGWLAFFGLNAAAIGSVIYFALRNQKRPERRGVALGLWIGLGIGLLAVGLCFGVGMG